MEKELLFAFLRMLYPSKVGNDPNAHRYARSLDMEGITDLWTLLRKSKEELLAISGIGPAFIKTLESYKNEKGL